MFLNLFLFYQVVRPLGRKSVNKYLYLYLYLYLCALRVAGETVWSHLYTRAVSERFKDKELIMKRYINSSVYFTYLHKLINY